MNRSSFTGFYIRATLALGDNSSPNGMTCGCILEAVLYMLLGLAALVDRCFFCLDLAFWNQTWITRLLNPVCCAILSRSWPSGLLSTLKLACSTFNWSSEKV